MSPNKTTQELTIKVTLQVYVLLNKTTKELLIKVTLQEV